MVPLIVTVLNGLHNCKRLRAPPRQPGRPQDKEERGFRKKREEGQSGWGVGGVGGGGGGGWGGVGGGGVLRHSPCRSHRQLHGIGLQLLQGIGGGPTGRGGGGGGGVRKCGMGGRVGLGGRRPDPGLLVPDASRQEAGGTRIPIKHCWYTGEHPPEPQTLNPKP